MSGGMNLEQDAIVRIRSLNKTFTGRAGKVTALDGIDLDIRRGEIFGIIGLSGAGKSTLVRCINFLEKPTAGTVTVDGQELGSLSKKQLLEARRSMGMIFQQFNLLQQRTALQNICFPSRSRERARRTQKSNARRSCSRSSASTARATIRLSSPAVSASASPSPVRSRPVRRSCSATRRPARSTRRPPARSSPCSRRSTGPSASPSSSSRTRWRSSRRSASASPSSTPAASLRSAR